MCELLEKAILTVKKVWRAIIDKLVKKSVIAVLSVTVVHLVIAAVICNLVYDHYVIAGNIGSVSDILIASFTGLISLATTLLLVIAVINLKEWKLAKEFDVRLDLIKKLSLFYLCRIRLRVSKVKVFEIEEDIENLKSGNSLFFKGKEASISKIYNNELEIEFANIKQLEAELNKIELEIYLLIANVSFAKENEIIEFIKDCKGCLVDYKTQLNESYKSISISLLGSPRELSSFPESEAMKRHAGSKTFKEFLYRNRNLEV